MKKIEALILMALLGIFCLTLCSSSEDDSSESTTTEENSSDSGSSDEDDGYPVPALDYEVTPTGTDNFIDAPLTLTFSTAPALGSEGLICIYESDGTLVDYIDMADVAAEKETLTNNETIYNTAMDAIGSRSKKRYRIIHYDPVTVSGKSVIIKPHYASLDYATEYYVTIDESVISHASFAGVDADDDWVFTTKSKPSLTSSISVDPEDGDFATIQAAIDYATESSTSSVTISIADGTYEEKLFMRSRNNITFVGESREGTIIQAENSNQLASGVGASTTSLPTIGETFSAHGGRAVMLIESCDNVRFENLTMQNTYDVTGSDRQAEVLYFNASTNDYRLAFVGCDLLSGQDTFNLKGDCWFYDCLIEGDVDYVWGSPIVALFEECEMRSIASGYIVQARCTESTQKGFVFLNCDLTAADGYTSAKTYLARSAGSDSYYDNVAYVNCTMSSVIAGWYTSPTPNPSSATATSGWKMYGNTDSSGSSVSFSNCYSLSDSEYSSDYASRELIFSHLSDLDWLSE